MWLNRSSRRVASMIDEVKAAAKYITLTNAESGVAAAVKKFVLGQD